MLLARAGAHVDPAAGRAGTRSRRNRRRLRNVSHHSLKRYDPESQRWSLVGETRQGIGVRPRLRLVPEGVVFIADRHTCGIRASADVVNPDTNGWSSTASWTQTNRHPNPGGFDQPGQLDPEVDIRDYSTTRLLDGLVLVSGGRDRDAARRESFIAFPTIPFARELLGPSTAGRTGPKWGIASDDYHHLFESEGIGNATRLLQWDVPAQSSTDSRYSVRLTFSMKSLFPEPPGFIHALRVDRRGNLWLAVNRNTGDSIGRDDRGAQQFERLLSAGYVAFQRQSNASDRCCRG